MDRFDIQDAFDEIVSAEQIAGDGKPAPDIYLHTASLLAVAPRECVAIEDSTHGVQAAKAADMYCIGFRGTGDEQQDLSAADTIAESPNELRRQLLSVSS